MSNIDNCKQTVDGILKKIPGRTQEILSRRFGIGPENKSKKGYETLESIGRDFGITRERVRQIENKGLEEFKHSPYFADLQRFFLLLQNFIDEQGGLKRQDILEKTLVSEEQLRPYLLFLLKINNSFLFEPESPSFYSSWKTKKEVSDIADKVVRFLIDSMEKEKRLFSEEELLERGTKEIPKYLYINIPPHYLISYIEATKKIGKDHFNNYGPIWWPEVNPRGGKDYAYIILKAEKRPFHFCEIAKKIEDTFQKPIQTSSLHNELIKSDKFILMGRGIYGLKEWGYKEGILERPNGAKIPFFLVSGLFIILFITF